MIRRPPRSTHTYTLLPYTTLFLSSRSKPKSAILDNSPPIFQVWSQRDFTSQAASVGAAIIPSAEMWTSGPRLPARSCSARVRTRLEPTGSQRQVTQRRSISRRSEERRVGKQCVSTCTSRGGPENQKQK